MELPPGYSTQHLEVTKAILEDYSKLYCIPSLWKVKRLGNFGTWNKMFPVSGWSCRCGTRSIRKEIACHIDTIDTMK